MFSKRLSSVRILEEISAREAANVERAARIARLHEEKPGAIGLKLREQTRRELTKAEGEIDQLKLQLVIQLERERGDALGLKSGKKAAEHRAKRRSGRCICCPRPTSLKPDGTPYAKCDAHRAMKKRRQALIKAEAVEAAFIPQQVRPR